MLRTQNVQQQQNESIIENDSNNRENANAWNIDVFVQTVQEMNPSLAWKDVVKEFDHPEFFIRDKITFKQLINALKKALKDTGFPIEYIYKVWKNAEGQVNCTKI